MKVTVEKIVYPGKSLARASGQVIFTDEGLPGEVVEIEILKPKKNYIEARTIQVLEPSPSRQLPICSHYQACSPYQIMSYELELKIKSQQLSEIISRFLHQKEKSLEFIPSPTPTGYRYKIALSFNWGNQPAFLSYHQPGSRHSFLRVDSCALVSNEVNAIISRLNGLLNGVPLPAISHLEIRQSFWTKEILLVFYSEEEESLEKAVKFWLPALALEPLLIGAVGGVEEKRKIKYFPLYGRNYLEEKIDTITLRYGAGCFFQANLPMLKKVTDRIKEILNPYAPVKLLDLYAGVGTFGLILADKASEVMAVESEPENIFYLKKNRRLNHIQHLTIAAGQSEDFAEEIQNFHPQVAVIDPPRKGLAPELIATLRKIKADLLFYLSCNPTTLARDLNLLLPDYELSEITGFDFFPRTPHIEALAILKVKK